MENNTECIQEHSTIKAAAEHFGWYESRSADSPLGGSVGPADGARSRVALPIDGAGWWVEAVYDQELGGTLTVLTRGTDGGPEVSVIRSSGRWYLYLERGGIECEFGPFESFNAAVDAADEEISGKAQAHNEMGGFRPSRESRSRSGMFVGAGR